MFVKDFSGKPQFEKAEPQETLTSSRRESVREAPTNTGAPPDCFRVEEVVEAVLLGHLSPTWEKFKLPVELTMSLQ